jgi:uncharacterized DUF497 family protein
VLDLDRLVGFEWDAGNRGKNLKHDVSDGEAEQVFFSHPLLVLEDSRHSGREARYHALGVTQDDRRLHVTFTLRDTGSRIRVISAREMHRKERAIYDAKAKENP